jgi:hypothetical protein
LSFSPRAELASFRRFLAAPRPMRQGDPVASDWVVRAAFFAAVTLAVNIALSAITDPLTDWAGLRDKWPATPTAGFIVMAVVLAPFVEELLFRAGLRLPAYALYIGPPLCVAVFGPGRASLVIAAGLALLLGATAGLRGWIARRKPGGGFGFERRFVARYAWVFWGYCALFAIAHVGNYEWQVLRSTVAVLGVLPQFVAGVFLSYLRLRDGLRSSMLAHLLNNAVGVALLAVGS